MRPGFLHWLRHVAAAFSVLGILALIGCVRSDGPPEPSEGQATIGAAGGTVQGPDGVQLVVPAGALDRETTIRIARSSSGAPALSGDLQGGQPIYEITPHGLLFAEPATLRLPIRQSPTEDSMVLVAEPGGEWQGTPATFAGGFASIERRSLSWYAIGPDLHLACAPQASDPYTCVWPTLRPGGDVTVTPPEALRGGGLHPFIVQPATVAFPLAMSAARDCFAAVLKVDRRVVPPGTSPTAFIPYQRVLEQPLGLGPSPTSSRRATATYTYVAQVGPGETGAVGLRFTFSCRRAHNDAQYNVYLETGYRTAVPPQPGTPTITQQPQDVTTTAGNRAEFRVAATAPNTLVIHWQRSNDGGATWADTGIVGEVYALAQAQLADNGARLRASVCSQLGVQLNCVTSRVATLTVTRASVVPSFTMQPASLAVSAGQTASFTAVATGVPAPSIRWQTAAAGSSTFTDLTTTACPQTPAASTGDSTAATCTVGPVTLGDNGRRYRALAINAVAAPGVPSNEATLTVTSAPTAPSITTQPASQSTTVGGSASFTVVATGTAPLSYAWRLNGSALPSAGAFTVGACTGTVGASGATLTLNSLSAGCNGAAVTVVVSNGINPDATSTPATLTVTPAGGPGLALLAGAIGGPGTVDGAGNEARVQFGSTAGIAVDGAGTAYFSDPIAGRLRRVTAAGVVTTFPDALLAPAGVAVDAAGNAYVAERARHRILRFASDGTVSVWAGSGVQGTLDGTGTQARLSNPQFLAIDGSGTLFVVEDAGSAPRIRRISATQEVTTFHDFGSGGSGVAAIAATADGSVYGLGSGALSNTVQRIAPGGVVSLVAGGAGQEGNVDGSGASARFNSPIGLAFGADGNLYVTDSNNRTVRQVTTAGAVTTVSGAAVFPVVPADGTGTAGRYEFPTAIGRAPNGDLLVGDVSTMRRLTPSFVLTTFVGQRLVTGTADGSGAAARFSGPLGVALDASGNAYVADLDRIRVVTPAGAVTTLVTQQPARLIVRDAGNGFVVASDNAVWRMTAAGVATLLAGNPQEFDYVDAPVGTNARFGAIRGIAVDGGGAVFVAETINGNATIRRISPAGEVTTWAGARDAPPEIVDGDRLSARFGSLSGGLAFDAGGNLVVADFSPFTGAALLRRITPQGAVSTFVNGGALRPALVLALAPDGSLLAGGDATLQRVSAGGTVTTLVGTPTLRGVRLGASPNLNIVYGLAVRPNGQIVLTSEAAVLELTLP